MNDQPVQAPSFALTPDRIVRTGWIFCACSAALAGAGCSGPSATTRTELAARGVSPEARLARVEGEHRLALGGYDPVSYFSDRMTETSASAPGKQTPERGEPAHELVHQGARYRFSSDQHLQTFASSPERFVPAYGGWCATAMADGRFVESDPTNFRVQDGRLLVFYRFAFINAASAWDDDPAGLQERADKHWSRLVERERDERGAK